MIQAPATNKLDTFSPTRARRMNRLAQREMRFLRLNVVCAMTVLLFTAIATAV